MTPWPSVQDAQLFSEALDAVRREAAGSNLGIAVGGFSLPPLGTWTPLSTLWLWPDHSRIKENSSSGEILRVRVRVGSSDVFVASEGPSARFWGAGLRAQAGVTRSWRWVYGQRLRWHVESHYLFLRNPCPSPEKDSGCRTITQFAEVFGDVQSLRQRPLLPGREPAVCTMHFPAPPTRPWGTLNGQAWMTSPPALFLTAFSIRVD